MVAFTVCHKSRHLLDTTGLKPSCLLSTTADHHLTGDGIHRLEVPISSSLDRVEKFRRTKLNQATMRSFVALNEKVITEVNQSA